VFLCVSFVVVIHTLEIADAKICMLSGTRTFSVDRAMVIGRDQRAHKMDVFGSSVVPKQNVKAVKCYKRHLMKMKEPKEDGRMVNGHQYYRSCSKDTPNQE